MYDSPYHNVTEADVMPISIRGIEFKVNLNRLDEFPGTTLYDLACSWKLKLEAGSDRRPVYIDRNPIVFHCILDYYLTGELHLPDALCVGQVKDELDYWGIGTENIAPCCLWKTRNEITAIIDDIEYKRRNARTVREKAWILYTQPFHSKTSMVMYATLCFVYTLFLVSLVLQSVTHFREPVLGSKVNLTLLTSRSVSLLHYYRGTDLPDWLKRMDFYLLLVITLYVSMWFVISPDRKQYKSVISAVGGLGLYAQWLPVCAVTFYSPPPEWLLAPYIQGLKVFRILPVFGLLSPLKSMRILARALLESKNELGLLLVLVAMSTALFGYLVFVFEVGQEETHFRSIPDGFWWSLVTLTTVGYGDMFPQSAAGRMVGVVCAVAGILVIALPVPIISANFTKIYDLVGVAQYHRTLKKDSQLTAEAERCD